MGMGGGERGVRGWEVVARKEHHLLSPTRRWSREKGPLESNVGATSGDPLGAPTAFAFALAFARTTIEMACRRTPLPRGYEPKFFGAALLCFIVLGSRNFDGLVRVACGFRVTRVKHRAVPKTSEACAVHVIATLGVWRAIILEVNGRTVVDILVWVGWRRLATI